MSWQRESVSLETITTWVLLPRSTAACGHPASASHGCLRPGSCVLHTVQSHLSARYLSQKVDELWLGKEEFI